MTLSESDRALYLGAAEFIDNDHETIRALAESLRRSSDAETAIAMFDWVRDEIRYDPLCGVDDPPEEYRASAQPNRLLAKRFAAKEAVAKALGTGIGRGVSWQDIRVAHDDAGAPLVVMSGGALDTARRLGGERMALSIADEVEYVVAFAVLDK